MFPESDSHSENMDIVNILLFDWKGQTDFVIITAAQCIVFVYLQHNFMLHCWEMYFSA